MLDYRPVRGVPAPRLRLSAGIADFASGLTSGVAKNIVTEAEPAVRRVVRDERNRLAEALIGGIPFAAISAMAAVGTYYLVPEDSGRGKAVGYGASAVAAIAGAWWTMSHLTDDTLSSPLPAAVANASKLDPVIQQAAQTIVAEAEPKVRAIVEEEKARAVVAAKAAIPFAVLAGAALVGTMFLVNDDNKKMKVAGYSSVAALLGAGAWFALDKERDAVAAA